jgi:IS5 family transposase
MGIEGINMRSKDYRLLEGLKTHTLQELLRVALGKGFENNRRKVVLILGRTAQSRKAQEQKDDLQRLANSFPWDSFRSLMERRYNQVHKRNTGGERSVPTILIKMLDHQQLFNHREQELEIEATDKKSFEEFVGLGVMNCVPVFMKSCFFKDRRSKAVLIEEVFEMIETYLRFKGLQDRCDQINDATLDPAPKQRSTKEAHKETKVEMLPENWHMKTDGLDQRLQYTLRIRSDYDYVSIPRYTVTPANIHESQVLLGMLNSGNKQDGVEADFPYSGQCRKNFLDYTDYESMFQEKGTNNHLLRVEPKSFSPVKSSIGA